MSQALSISAVIIFFLLGFQCTRYLEKKHDFWRILVLSLPLSCALMILAVGLVGRIVHRFDWGLWGGAGVAAIGSLFLYRKNPKEPLCWKFRVEIKDLPLLLFLVLSTIGIAWVAFKYALWDEVAIQGHPALVESMLRGVYPLYFLSFPDIPNKYHIGFDMLAAVFSKSFGISSIHSVDVAAVFVWVSLVLFLAIFLFELGVPRALLGMALAFVVFSGGLSWILPGNDVNGYQIPMWQFFTVANRYSHFNFVFYFYQHPISFGALVFCSVLRIFQQWLTTRKNDALFVFCLALGALSLVHVMFFTTLLAALGVFFASRLWISFSSWGSDVKAGILIFSSAIILAYALGGFFQLPSPKFAAEAAKFAWPPGYLRYEFFGAKYPMTWQQVAVWYVGSFGIFLAIFPWALVRMRRENRPIMWVLAIYCLLSILIPQFVYYAFSSNIQKWFLGFEFSGKILCAVLLLPLCLSQVRRMIAYCVVLAMMVTPVAFIYGRTLKPYQKLNSSERRIANDRHVEPAGNYLKVVQLLTSDPGNLGMIWASPLMSRSLAINTGFPVLEVGNNILMPIARDLLQERKNQINQLFSKPTMELFSELHVRWVIFSCDELHKFPEAVQNFVDTLRYSNVAEDLSLPNPPAECLLVLKTRLVR